MDYTCHHCEHETTSTAHSITLYGPDGTEDRYEVLCETCYDEWLHAWKG